MSELKHRKKLDSEHIPQGTCPGTCVGGPVPSLLQPDKARTSDYFTSMLCVHPGHQKVKQEWPDESGVDGWQTLGCQVAAPTALPIQWSVHPAPTPPSRFSVGELTTGTRAILLGCFVGLGGKHGDHTCCVHALPLSSSTDRQNMPGVLLEGGKHVTES